MAAIGRYGPPGALMVAIYALSARREATVSDVVIAAAGIAAAYGLVRLTASRARWP